jgi:hypothetical protein
MVQQIIVWTLHYTHTTWTLRQGMYYMKLKVILN